MLRYRIYNKFCDFWREYARFAIILLLFIAFGIVIGALGGNSVSALITTDELKKQGLKYLVHSKYTFGRIFSANFLEIIFIFGIVIIANINIIFFPANYIYALYRGYIIGYNAVVVVKIFGFSGVMNVILIFLPQEIILTAYFIIVSSWCSSRCLKFKNQGFLNFSYVEYKPLLRRIIYLTLICLGIIVILSIILGMFASKAAI